MPIQQTDEKNEINLKSLGQAATFILSSKLGRIRICTKLYYDDVDIHYGVSLSVSGAVLSTRTCRLLLSVVSFLSSPIIICTH